MKTLHALGVALWLPCMAFGQNAELQKKYAAFITQEELRQDLEEIASDAYEGRDTGKPGQKKAADYIRSRFISYGIPPVPDAEARGIVEGYYQPFELLVDKPGAVTLIASGREFKHMDGHFTFGDRLGEPFDAATILYMGDGSGPMGEAARDAVVLVRDPAKGLAGMEAFRSLITHALPVSLRAEDAGARVLIVVSENTAPVMAAMGHQLGEGRMRLAALPGKDKEEGMQTLFMSPKDAERMLADARLNMKKLAKLKPGRSIAQPTSFKLAQNGGRLQSENVLGYIEGTDKKDELIVVTAHYDHIGVEDGEVYNGADDDGSGTVAIMAMAKAFAQAKADGHGPRRSILIMPVSAEEKGLLGSRYYSEFPVFPLENTVANLNIDMIGRVDSANAASPPYVYVIGSDRLSKDLHRINEEANAHVGLKLDYTFNAPDDPNRFYYRSDHYNFARKGVPAIFYFSGVHEDYHGPGDTVDKIRFDLLHQRSLLVFHTAWELANREDRIVVDGEVE